MSTNENRTHIEQLIYTFLTESFPPHPFNRSKENFNKHPAWARFRELGTRLWLDTGSIEDARKLWTQEFSALTTNNTLLSKEVQTGRYDSLIAEAADILTKCPQLSQQEKMLEFAFILNARHGLRLVEKFDAYVSVEEHTALANEVDRAVDYAKRFYAVCPRRFIIKIPFTPAGLLATHRLSAEGIPVNHTLGFSARQNYLTARIARPAYLNVFLGRLNSFIADNSLGDGAYVGEKATLASQAVITKLRQTHGTPSRQIGASFRTAAQVRDLAGIDVMTMPPKVAADFLAMSLSTKQITDRTAADYKPGLNENVNPDMIRLNTLWDLDREIMNCIEDLEKENLDSFTPSDLVNFFRDHKCADCLVRWSASQIRTSEKEGKIPNLQNWKDALAERAIGLDSLMNLAGLNSFATDQQAMDDHIRQVLAKSKKTTLV